jgi:hypothetical protein
VQLAVAEARSSGIDQHATNNLPDIPARGQHRSGTERKRPCTTQKLRRGLFTTSVLEGACANWRRLNARQKPFRIGRAADGSFLKTTVPRRNRWALKVLIGTFKAQRPQKELTITIWNSYFSAYPNTIIGF